MSKRVVFIHSGGPAIEQVRQHLERDAIYVLEASWGCDPLELCRREQPDALVVSAGPAVWEAAGMCATLRAHPQSCGTPVVLIGEAFSETERILALELGASDFIMQPFSPREAAARIKVQLRRPWQAREVLRAGALVLDRTRREVRLSGRPIDLTGTEFRVLEALMSRPGIVLSDRELLQLGWGTGTQVNEKTVRAYIVRLRRKLADDALKPRIIRSVRGFGYSLEVPPPA